MRKPGQLDDDERAIMAMVPQLSVQILSGSTNDDAVLDIVATRPVWFNAVDDRHRCGDALPLGSRMLSIVGAFDAMTSDTVYRRAISREAALAELYAGLGTQFDPKLVKDFVRLLEDQPEALSGRIARRWLRTLNDGQSHGGDIFAANGPGSMRPIGTTTPDRSPLKSSGMADCLLDHWLRHTREGVVFVDGGGIVKRYNERMERLCGVPAAATIDHLWTNKQFRLDDFRNLDDSSADIDGDLVRDTLHRGGVRTLNADLCVDQKCVPVEVTSSVVYDDSRRVGVMMVFKDRSEQQDMRETIETLNRRVTTDQLTGVANRAHFDTKLSELVTRKTKQKNPQPFTLIICDIDHFKRVNDVHGHPAGDEALVSFAGILQSHCRENDLVARYGGEEFLFLSDECDIATATRRAEQIRGHLERTPLPSLKNSPVTASFGVTQVQSGDTAESVLARADRALLKAKENGRNRVVQIGNGGVCNDVQRDSGSNWLAWLGYRPNKDTSVNIVTTVPIDLAIEKLRGFIADHSAEVLSVAENELAIRVHTRVRDAGRRTEDHRIALRVDLTLSELRPDGKSALRRTNAHVTVVPTRNRDRRGGTGKAAVDQVISSLRSYLMGELQ